MSYTQLRVRSRCLKPLSVKLCRYDVIHREEQAALRVFPFLLHLAGFAKYWSVDKFSFQPQGPGKLLECWLHWVTERIGHHLPFIDLFIYILAEKQTFPAMPLRKARPELQRSTTSPVPELTHQPSSESVGSPITPAHDVSIHPLNRNLKISTDNAHISYEQNGEKSRAFDAYPFPAPMSAPAGSSEFPSSPKVPSKDLPFLSTDPYANLEDDVIPFDKNKPIIPSRSGSVRSIMSTSSMRSLKRGMSSLKRKLTRRSRSRPPEGKLRQPTGLEPMPGQLPDEDGIMPINRTQTYMMGPSFGAPRRVETYQVSAMAL